MIRLQPEKLEPYWVELIPAGEDGVAVRIFVMPLDRGRRRRGRRAGSEALDALVEPGTQFEDLDAVAIGDASEAISREVIRRGILDVPEDKRAWEGILGPDDEPAPVTPENVEMALADDTFFEAADLKYVLQSAVRDQEKNGSAALQNGTGKAATPGSDIATSPAAAKKTAGAKPARTSRTSSKPRKPRTPGKS